MIIIYVFLGIIVVGCGIIVVASVRRENARWKTEKKGYRPKEIVAFFDDNIISFPCGRANQAGKEGKND